MPSAVIFRHSNTHRAVACASRASVHQSGTGIRSGVYYISRQGIQPKNIMTDLEFSGVYLTVKEHGCVYTVCTEGELLWAPIYHDGSINLEEFDYVDFMALMGDEVEMREQLDEIQLTLCKMMQAAGLFYTTVPV